MSATATPDPASVSRVLLVRPRFMGDVCLTLPTLDAVRATCPSAKVAYVVERGSAPLLEGDPRVDELITVPRSPGPIATLKLLGALRRFKPEVAFDFFCNPRTAQWTWMSGAKTRVGYADKGWRSSLYTHHSRPRTLSAVGFHLNSLSTLGWPVPVAPVPKLHVLPEVLERARAALQELVVPRDAVMVGFHPGARWPTRRWAPENFVALAKRFLEAEPKGMALITAGPGEARTATLMVAALGDRARLIEEWPLARFVALQSLCRAFVCGDTGPLHSAVASGAPTLALMSRNRPAMFFPYADSDTRRAYYTHAECSPCDRDVCGDLRCLRTMNPDGAWKLLETLLARGRAAPAVAAAG